MTIYKSTILGYKSMETTTEQAPKSQARQEIEESMKEARAMLCDKEKFQEAKDKIMNEKSCIKKVLESKEKNASLSRQAELLMSDREVMENVNSIPKSKQRKLAKKGAAAMKGDIVEKPKSLISQQITMINHAGKVKACPFPHPSLLLTYQVIQFRPGWAMLYDTTITNPNRKASKLAGTKVGGTIYIYKGSSDVGIIETTVAEVESLLRA